MKALVRRKTYIPTPQAPSGLPAEDVKHEQALVAEAAPLAGL